MSKGPHKMSIIIIGDCSVGKSTFLKRYITGMYSQGALTIVSDAFKKTLTLPSGDTVQLILVDTAGSEQFKSITRSYYREKEGVILAYD
jgi:small GTP-binding protein